MSAALTKFDSIKSDVQDLLGLHTSVSGAGRGRRPSQVQILNKSAIIFCAAIWEAYIEEVVEEAVNHLATHTADKTKLTPYMRQLIEKNCQGIIKADQTKLWDIAAKSVGDLIRDNAKKAANTLPSKNSELNTVKTAQVSELIKECIGLDSIQSNWFWAGMSAVNAAKKLDDYIKLRGDLAHGNRSIGTVDKLTASQMLTHIEGLVRKTDAAISAHLNVTTGTPLPK